MSWTKVVITPDDPDIDVERVIVSSDELVAADWFIISNPQYKWRVFIDTADVKVASTKDGTYYCILVYLKEGVTTS